MVIGASASRVVSYQRRKTKSETTAGTLVSKPTTSSMPRGGRAQALRVGQGEAVGGHAHYDRLGVADERIPILPQGLSRVDVALRNCIEQAPDL